MSVWDKVGIAGIISGYNALKTSINALRVNDDGSIDVNVISGGGGGGTGLTDAQLRASPVPVSQASAPLPAGAATATNQATQITDIGDVVETAPASDTASSGLNGRLQRIAQRLTSLITLLPTALTGSGNLKISIQEATATVPVSNVSLPLPTGAATAANQTTELTQLGIVTETAPASDTASSGLNGRLQRIAQRLTSLIALVPAALTGSGNFKVALAESTATQAISAASLPLPTGAATEATLDTRTGSLTETAPVSDTASSGINGRLQRIAQRLTSLIALLPTALGANGGLKIEGVASGTAVPMSAASLPLPAGAATSTNQATDQTLTGAVTETAPASDTASSGLNGRLQRIAQRLTSLIAQSPAALGQTTKAGSFAVVLASDDDVQAKLGIVTETAPASDTASSGLNGRLQRIAQRLTSLIALRASDTGTQSSVASSATDVTILAANTARLGASVFNDSTAVLYLLSGAGTSSATVYTVQVPSGGYYEIPFGYTGILKGLWAAANGSARVTEFT